MLTKLWGAAGALALGWAVCAGAADAAVTYTFDAGAAGGFTYVAPDILTASDTFPALFDFSSCSLGGVACVASDYIFLSIRGGGGGLVDIVGMSNAGNFIQNSFDGASFGTNGSHVSFQDPSITLTVSGAATGVPEPGAWSLLIAGFGLIGLTQRRRRGALAA
jgi:hypothetical protein